MIDSISTSTVQSAALRVQPQAASASQVAEAAPSAATLPTTRIRVDNNLDRAIIEVRSSENGQVLRQYPTQAQLRAFARAESLRQARQNEEAAARQAAEQLAAATKKSGGSSAAAAPAPQPSAESRQPSPAPQSSGSDGASTQSVDV